MSVPVGYSLDRVDVLSHHTRRAIDELDQLRRLRAGDPAAAIARDAIEAAARMLETHWLPLIAAIRTTDALISWRRSTTTGVIDLVSEFDRSWPQNRDGRDLMLAEMDAADRRALTMLAAELRSRIADDDFRMRLLDAAGHTPALAMIVAMGGFDPSFAAEVLRRLVDPARAVGHRFPDVARHGAAVTALLREVSEHPPVALDLLLDDVFVDRLIWAASLPDPLAPPGQTDALAGFVQAGLVVATADLDRLADGFAALRRMVARADDEQFARDGFPPGLARGLAGSVGRYVPHFAAWIDGQDSAAALRDSTINVDADGDGRADPHGALGTYGEVADFVGALLHDDGSIAALGLLVSDASVRSAHGALDFADLAELAGLLQYAAAQEDAEARLTRAADEARANRLFGVLSAIAGVGVAATGAGAAAKAVVKQGIAVTRIVSSLDRADRRDGSNGDTRRATPDFGALVRFTTSLETVRLLAHDDTARAAAGITSPTAGWAELADAIDRLDAAAERGDTTVDFGAGYDNVFDTAVVLGAGPALTAIADHVVIRAIEQRDPD